MYEKRFGLHRKPFQSVLTDHDFYESETFREILPGMLHALRSDLGVAVLTGPAGVGKSVTLENVRRRLEGDCQAVLIRGGTVRSAADLLYMLHRRLLTCQPSSESGSDQEASDSLRRWQVVERLQRVADFWGPLVILLDDAHLVEPEVFVELRALLEEEVSGQKLLRLLITGPLVLEEVLAEPNRSDFAQKIRSHVFLQPLKSSEAVSYLRHNISNAGGEIVDVMENSAIERIVAASDGVPRCLNLLADESLMMCEELGLDCVTRTAVDRALTRLQHLPYTWNVSLSGAIDDDSVAIVDSGSSSNTDSIVEFGAPAAAVHSAPGVIEIGGPATPETTSSDVTADDSSVVEICAPAEYSSASNSMVTERNDVVESRDSFDDNITQTVEADESSSEIADLAEEFSTTEIDEEEFYSNEDAEESVGPTDPDRFANEDKLRALFESVAFPDSGTEPEEHDDTADDCEQVAGTAPSLEHHLLLAGADQTDVETLSVDELDATPPEFHEVVLKDYSRWEPAGSWPVMLQKPAPVGCQDRPNATPVFDRFTWCELGRPVAPKQLLRNDSIVTILPFGVWPPVTDRLSPDETIPVHHVDADCSDLMLNLGRLIDVVTEDTSQDVTIPVDRQSFSQSEPEWKELPDDTHHAEASMDRIQDLLDLGTDAHAASTQGFFLAETDASLTNVEEPLVDAADDDLDVDEERWNGGPLPDGDSVDGASSYSDLIEDDESQNADRDDLSQTIAIEIGSNSTGNDCPDGYETVPHSAGESATDLGRAASQESYDGDVADASTLNDEELLSEERRVGAFVADTDEELEQQYVPRLMQQARQRLVTHSAVSRGLRRAAGAESISDASAASRSDSDRPCLSLSIGEDTETASETTEVIATADSRFRSLFTRLRKLGGR